MTFKALLATKTGDTVSTNIVNFDGTNLMPGDVTVAIDHSTVDYKDAMAISGRALVDVSIDLTGLAYLVQLPSWMALAMVKP
jgi:NADPH:quinone reductase-like Zn-dependent oxidoreductase